MPLLIDQRKSTTGQPLRSFLPRELRTTQKVLEVFPLSPWSSVPMEGSYIGGKNKSLAVPGYFCLGSVRWYSTMEQALLMADRVHGEMVHSGE